VLFWEDYCYKPGRRPERGHRTKRVFELMDLDNLGGKTILDVGCGIGEYSVFFAMLGATVHAIELSLIGATIGKYMAGSNNVSDKCHFSVQNISDLAFPNEYFDIVLFHESLHHAIKYPNVKESTFRVTKTGGSIICAETIEGNYLFSIGRYFTMRGQDAKGDVQLNWSDINTFSQGYSEKQIEPMSLFFMVKRIFRPIGHYALVRWILFVLKKLDDFLMSMFPFLQRYCGEIVIKLDK